MYIRMYVLYDMCPAIKSNLRYCIVFKVQPDKTLKRTMRVGGGNWNMDYEVKSMVHDSVACEWA